MVRHASLLSQILGFIPRLEFAEVFRKHEAERCVKGFSSWDQLTRVLFCQLGQAHSLREVVGGLGSMLEKQVHLGLKGAPKRSSLSSLFKILIGFLRFFRLRPMLRREGLFKTKKRFRFLCCLRVFV